VPPSAADFGSEAIQSVQIRGHSIVAEVAFHDTMQPSADDGHRFVPSPEKRLPDCGQRCSHSLLYRQAHHSKAALPVLPTAVSEAQKVEGLRSSIAPCAPTFSREPAELDQPRFILVQR
jgi:hypothetical protein